jgi:DNA-binding NarL/FixJ family response regulator
MTRVGSRTVTAPGKEAVKTTGQISQEPLQSPVPKVLVVDDQNLFRSGLVKLLENDPRIQIVGQTYDGAEAVKLIQSLQPDVVLMDVRMPNMDGLEAAQRIRATYPKVRVLMLSGFGNESQVIHALNAGASGYVVKDSPLEAIVTSILAVVAGARVLSEAIADRVLSMISGGPPSKTMYDGLTQREVEILRLLATGVANKQVAFRLKISDKTVRNHISHIYEKLNIFDRSQAVLYAVRKGLVEV